MLIAQCQNHTPEADKTAIKAVMENYRTSWLKGDARGVQNTFTEDAVLLPADGGKPVVGKKAIIAYWWPSGAPPTPVLELNITVDEVDGECGLAYARGTDEVAWSSMEKGKIVTHKVKGTYLNVFRKGKDGKWRISHHMWDNPKS